MSPGSAVGWVAAIVMLILLGGGFWMALGEVLSAANGVREAIPRASRAPLFSLTAEPMATGGPALVNPEVPPISTAVVAVPPTSTPLPAVTPSSTATAIPASTPTPTETVRATPTETVGPSPTASASASPGAGRDPWVLLPMPEPGSRVPPGRVTIEARGRGDAPIAQVRLEVDRAALDVALDQRSDSIWRGQAAAFLEPGRHEVRATVVDVHGRTGSYRWTFEVAASR